MTIDSTTKVYLGGVEQVKIMRNGSVIWEKQQDNTDYFYIENTYQGQNTITLTTTKTGSPSSSDYSNTVEYSKDRTNWTTLNLTPIAPNTITLNEDEKVYFRNGNGKFNFNDGTNSFYTNLTGSQSHTAGGRICSLVDYLNPDTVTLKGGAFQTFLQGNTNLTDASSLVLPQQAISFSCCRSLFNGCSSLIHAPSIPDTTLADSCFRFMFKDCSSLITAPELPATTLYQYCYNSMFQNCTSLTETPELPATTLVKDCYYNMFNGCSNLSSVTSYANDISASSCLNNWLNGVSATGVFHNYGSATYSSGASGIPSGWRIITTDEPFYIENTYAGQNTITLTTTSAGSPSSSDYSDTVQYSKDRETWTTLTLVAGGTNTITLNQGEKVYFRNNNGKFNFDDGTNNFHTTFTGSQTHSAGGWICSLVDYLNPDTVTLKSGVFNRLLDGDTYLTDVTNLVTAGQMTIPEWCYVNTFRLTGITTAPSFSHITFIKYAGMSGAFANCYSLTTPPDFPLLTTTGERSSFSWCFHDCTALTRTPNFPSLTSVGLYGFNQAFYGCTSLTGVSYISNVTSVDTNGFNRAFYGCTSLTTSPDFRGITSVSGSAQFGEAFYGCRSLNKIYAPTLSTGWTSTNFSNWVKGVAATGFFYYTGTATVPSGNSGIPSGWTRVNN